MEKAPRSLPVLGHLLILLRDPLGFVAGLSASGELAEIQFGPSSRLLMVCDPELTRQVLREDAIFDKGGPMVDRAREIAGDGLATCPHARHRRQRRLVQPAFHHDRLPGYAKAMSEEIVASIGRWRDGQVIDIPAEMLGITLRTSLKTMFSGSLAPRVLSQTMDDVVTMLRGVYWRAVLPSALSRLPTPGNYHYWRAQGRLQDTVYAVIAERRASPADRGDLLSALLAARDPESGEQSLSEAEIADQVRTFFLAGPETTADLIAWALYLVARHPDVGDRLRAEADSVLAGAPPGLEHVPRLELTGRVLEETLRLYPPIWMLTRVVTTDTELGGHRIPAGTPVLFSSYLQHHRGSAFEAPERFDPDRWDGGRKAPRGTFIPFGSGPRRCIGDQFGLTMATFTLAAVTASWHLQTLPGRRPPHPATALSLRPRGLRMRATTRARTAA
jgi:pentalenene oxygenase